VHSTFFTKSKALHYRVNKHGTPGNAAFTLQGIGGMNAASKNSTAEFTPKYFETSFNDGVMLVPRPVNDVQFGETFFLLNQA